MVKKTDVAIGDSNAIGDLMITGTQLSVGAVENLSTLTVRGRNSFQLTGTIELVYNSNTLTGTGTKFLSELVVGDRIDTYPGGYNSVGTVTAITSDTSLTLDIAAQVGATGQQLDAYPSIARFDNAAGDATVMINDGGDIGIGTLAPRAQLHVTGAGSGDFIGCPVSIRAHSPQGGDAYALVLTCDADDGPSGAAMWVDEYPPGNPELKITPAADMGGMNDTLTVGLNGVGVCGALRIQPTEVSTDYTVQDPDLYVYANAGPSGVTVTLPMSSDSYGRVLYIYKTAGAGDITIVPAATDNINGAASSKTINGSFAGLKLVAMYSSWIATTLPAA